MSIQFESGADLKEMTRIIRARVDHERKDAVSMSRNKARRPCFHAGYCKHWDVMICVRNYAMIKCPHLNHYKYRHIDQSDYSRIRGPALDK